MAKKIVIVEQRTAKTMVPHLWSARSLSARWGVSRALIYKLFHSGRLRGVRLFGCLRFMEEDVLALLREEGVNVD